MKVLVWLAAVSVFTFSYVHADDFDWNIAASEGGIWTSDLGSDSAGQLRAIVGQTRQDGGRSDSMVNIVINDTRSIPLFRGVSEDKLEVRLNGGIISVKVTGYLTPGSSKPTYATTCFKWSGKNYQETTCP